MDKQPSYYAILTADVRYDERLSSSEKLFYAEVTALSNKTGECWASRRYFAELYGVTKRTITNWTNKLCELKYIDVDYEYSDSGEIKKRAIRISNTSGIHIVEGVKNNSGVVKKSSGGSEINNRGGSEEKFTVNSTRDNNTRENISEGSFFAQIEQADTKPKLLEIWNTYRKSKGKHMNLYEREVLMKSTWKAKTVNEIKRNILYTIENGWFTLQEREVNNSESKPSYYQQL